MERKRSVRRQRRYDRPFAKKCKELFRQFIAFLFSNIGIILLVVGYVIAGAFIFMTIERTYVMKIKEEVNRTRNIYAMKLFNLTNVKLNPPACNVNLNPNCSKEIFYPVVMEELYQYQLQFVDNIRKGYDGLDISYAAQWSFAGAFLYSLTVITTIGYGNIFPHTPQGKITTIIYAIIGMPLFLLYLSNIGDIMARSFKWIYANLCLCRWCPGVAKRRAERRIRRAQQYELDYVEDGSSENSDESSQRGNIEGIPKILEPRASIISTPSEVWTDAYTEGSYDVETVTVPVTICLAIMVGYICGGALLFCKWEDWAFMDASYFCFISLSTIGFGDIVPGDKIYGHGDDIYSEVLEISFVFCSMYLMLGMALIAMCFNLMQEEVIHKIRTTVRTIKYVLRCNR